MAAITPCTIRSITLSPGESYVLPPGAKLKGSTGESKFTSSCDIPLLETIQCYRFSFAISDSSGTAVPFETDEYNLDLYLGTTKYVIVEGMSDGNAGDTVSPPIDFIKDKLGNIVSNTYFEGERVGTGVGADRKYDNTYFFRTIPSVAEKMKLVLNGPSFGNGVHIFPVSIPCP